MEVVGVVGHVKLDGGPRDSSVQLYIPFESDDDDTWSLVLRTETKATLLTAAVRNSVLELDPQQPLARVRTLAECLDDTTRSNRFLSVLLGAFAATALLLAAVGIYGVISCNVNERRREIGIRLALGAQRVQVLRMMLRQGLVMVLVAAGLGLVLALTLGRLVSSELYGVVTGDPLTWMMAPLFLCAVATLASYLSARRTTTVDPIETLRSE